MAKTLALGAMAVGIVGLAFNPASDLFFGLMASGAFCIVTWVD